MHGFDTAASPEEPTRSSAPWWKDLSRYHWFVLVVAALGWLFDTMDQQLFNLARVPAMRELLAPAPGVSPAQADVEFYGSISTSIFLLGWATGGLGFGILGDRIGRAKTMLLTILLYSAFTGLSALSWDPWSFAAFRFLTGLGVGGEFAVGVALVAEVMPVRARPFALGLLQALSAVGNISAAVISLVLFELEERGAVGSAWRIMFVIGALPALLAILIRRRLKEPEQWQAASDEQLQKQLGSYSELFGNPTWRRNAIVGLIMAASGVIGLWGIGFFSIDLTRSVFRKSFENDLRVAGEAEKDREFIRLLVSKPQLLSEAKAVPFPNQLLSPAAGNKDAEVIYSEVQKRVKAGETPTASEIASSLSKTDDERARRLEYLSGEEVSGDAAAVEGHTDRISKRAKKLTNQLGRWAAFTSVMLNIGAFFGIYAFTYVTYYTGRKPAFAVAFVLAMLSTVMVFGYLTEFSQIFWMIPIMGFCHLALFGGYAIYFPELFPTHLRSTGTSFCYNVGRFVAASGPFALGAFSKFVFHGYEEPMRQAGVTMSAIFLIGLLVLPFAPETKGKPLPE
ncbi:MFS transporter [Schlesneria sp. DSM 10557]|uniref:MFS transporter n=1 Tax=Schlesneria sp. DSM 10557 TaxID=3044399 RepID=UPI00359F4803